MSEMPPSSYTPPPPGGGSYTPPPPPPPPPAGGTGGGAPGSDRGLMLFLSYFGIFSLIPFLTKKDDREMQWHSKNGLTLTIAWLVVAIGWGIMQAIITMISWSLGHIFGYLGCLVGLGFMILDIMAMVKAMNGERMRIPVVSDLSEKMFGAS